MCRMTKPGRRLRRFFPGSTPAPADMTTGGSSVGLFMSCAPVSVGDDDGLNRFNRWSGRGRWQEDLRHVGRDTSRDTRSTVPSIKVQRSVAGGEGGACKQAIGRSRRGRTTKCMVLQIVRAVVPLHPDRRRGPNWPPNYRPMDA